MKRLQDLRCVCVVLFFLAVLTGFFFFDTRATAAQDTPAKPQIAGHPGSDVAHWKNGELVAPLPADPAMRAEAIRLVKETRRPLDSSSALAPAVGSRITRAEIQPHRVGTTRPTRVTAYASRRFASPFPRPLRIPAEPFVPTAEQLREAARIPVIVDPPSPAPAANGLMGFFDAIDDTGWTPASPDIAVGSDHLLVATTNVFAVYDKCGNWIDGGVLSEYFPPGGSYVCYDPRVIYDDWNGRWVLAYTAIDLTNDLSRVIFAISNSADLDDGWGGYYII